MRNLFDQESFHRRERRLNRELHDLVSSLNRPRVSSSGFQRSPLLIFNSGQKGFCKFVRCTVRPSRTKSSGSASRAISVSRAAPLDGRTERERRD